MTPNLSSLLDDIKNDKAYSSETNITDARLVRIVNSVHQDLVKAIYEGNPHALTYYIEYTAAASATLPPLCRRIQYVEHRDTSADSWVFVHRINLQQRDGLNDSTQVPDEGTFRVNYNRVPASLSYGTASSATSTTLVLAETPTYGETSLEDDYYNGCKIKIISGTTGTNCVATVTDYVGSTRTATVTFSTTPTGTIVYNIETDIPEDYYYDGMVQGAIAKLTRDQYALQMYNNVLMDLQSTSSMNGQNYTEIMPFEFYDYSGYKYYVTGKTIYFYEG